MDRIKAFFAAWLTAIKENGRATLIERPFTSGTLVAVGVFGTLVIQWLF